MQREATSNEVVAGGLPSQQSGLRKFARSVIRRNKLALLCALVMLVIVVAGALAPLVAPYSPTDSNLALSLHPPSAQHWFGTDKQGRDILSRVIFGSRTTLLGALGIVLIEMAIAVPLGLIAGYSGGWIDNLIMRAWDILLSIPSLLLAIVIVATFGVGLVTSVVALGVVYVPMLSRVTRSATIKNKQAEFVESARAAGASHNRILWRHLFPNVVSSVIVQVTLDLGYAIISLSSLSFLGFGVQPPKADWGAMLADGRSELMISPWTVVFSGLMIVISVLSFNIIGDALRSYLDPRQRDS